MSLFSVLWFFDLLLVEMCPILWALTELIWLDGNNAFMTWECALLMRFSWVCAGEVAYAQTYFVLFAFVSAPLNTIWSYLKQCDLKASAFLINSDCQCDAVVIQFACELKVWFDLLASFTQCDHNLVLWLCDDPCLTRADQCFRSLNLAGLVTLHGLSSWWLQNMFGGVQCNKTDDKWYELFLCTI